MANKRGRPPIDDRAALRRVAEYIITVEEKGTRCSARAAILRTSDRVTGNSSEAMLWRLQRKWRRDGDALLTEARERRATRRRIDSMRMRGGVDEFVRTLQSGRLAELHSSATSALRSLDQFKRAAERERAALGVVLRLREQIGRMADCDREMMRARRTFEQLTRGWWT